MTKGVKKNAPKAPQPMSPDEVRAVFAGLCEGRRLRELCPGGRQIAAFHAGIAADTTGQLEREYILCGETVAEILAEEQIDIADRTRNPAKAARQLQSRQWYAERLKSRRFGQRSHLTVEAEGQLDLIGNMAYAIARQELETGCRDFYTSIPRERIEAEIAKIQAMKDRLSPAERQQLEAQEESRRARLLSHSAPIDVEYVKVDESKKPSD